MSAEPEAARIRVATEDDLPRIVELLTQLSLDTPREDPGPPLPDAYHAAFRKIEATPDQQVLVLEQEGRIVGSAMFLIVLNLSHKGRPYAVIENVVVDATERGAGHGEALLRYAIEEARRAGCYKLSLTSNKQRKDAHRFYERLGFTATHEGFRIEY